MINESTFSSRLDELYRILSEAEKRELARYLGSSYFNRDKSLFLFHQFLCKEQPEEERYNKNTAWRFVFAKTPFNEKKFRYMVSDLIASTEEFIYVQQVLSEKPNYIHRLNNYYTLHEANLNRSALAVKIKNRAKKQVLDPEYFLEKHFEAELLEELRVTSVKAYSRNVSRRNTSMPGGLDAYYVIEKLKQMCTVANDNNVIGSNEKCFNEQEVLKLAAEPVIEDNIFVIAYLHVFHLLTKKQESSYYHLKKLIKDFGYEMDEHSLSEIMIYARNFCIARINAGQINFYEELFDLYKQGLSKNVLLPNGEINEQMYKNIVTTALRIGKHEWASDFINEYRYKLNKRVRDNAFHYNMANYLFNDKQFANVLRNLQKVQLADLFYGLDARLLMIKCYYELDEREAFTNAYESFRVFVQRRKNVSANRRSFYLNFLRIAKKLMNLRPRDKKAVEKIASEIRTAKAIADKNWLEEKVKVYL